ncbi:phytanoyl-CoA dioxygenase [Penicillium cataractarum]|uniref:Phytanoyl-CoA dioxygenase n=1 Tax=Penicillium cataractarum TaxID=2100454 RepID=A0A9W9SGJ7_9EURO|nr:phytanoyl-CoA dioxygenase [Penicillium cataractarum]KAJ5378198.1 phytanoyl-CoA dioxygenase [Penicillium cataractarum]
MTPISVPHVTPTDDPESITQSLRECGVLIIRGLLSRDQLQELNHELDKPLEAIQSGSKHKVDKIQDFHGSNTKRLTNVTTHSKIFRHQVLENELVHAVAERVFHQDSGTYWMGAAQVIQIGPGNKAQVLHRDQGQYPIFNLLGAKAPEATINFLIALTDFTEENGATRIIPGSHMWEDYSNMGSPDQTVPAIMKAGDAVLMSGKTVHGGGANKTKDENRRGLAFTLQCSYLTPEEANPFIIGLDTIKQLSPRAQRILGFRSQFPKFSPGLWQSDYSELADVIGLSGEDAALERLKRENKVTF